MNTWHCLELGQWHARYRDEEKRIEEEVPTGLITVHFQLSALIAVMICHPLLGLKREV